MSSRDEILNAIRRNAPAVAPAPQPMAGVNYDDKEKQFADAFTSVGGTFVRARDAAEVNEKLMAVEPYAKAKRIVSLVAGIGSPNVDSATMNDPHALEGVEVAILAGEFGVAENGAVWVPGTSLGPQRAIYVIAEHLVLIIPADQLVNNMHEAYARVRVERPGFGLFISGPSKTADIEQSLVIGAHGPRSCTLFLVG